MPKAVRRPLALVLVGSLCAFFLSLLFPARLPLLLAAAFAALCVLGPMARRFRRLTVLLLLFSGLVFGFLWHTAYDRLFMEPAQSLVGCRELVSATVVDKRSYGMVLRAEAGGHHFRVFCRYYDEDDRISPGDRLTFVTSFSLPANEGGFDQERFYSAEGIAVSCLLSEEVTVEKGAAPFYAAYYSLRHGALTLVSRLFGKYDGEMSALLLGEKSVLPEATKENLIRTGLSHTFVVSGMHLSFIVSMLSFLKGRKGYLWVVVPVSLLFAVFTGMGFSVVRAFLMLVYTLTADALSLPRDPATELSLSLVLILLYNPYALLNAGLIYSYLAVCGVFFLSPPLCAFLSSPLGHKDGLFRRLLTAWIAAFSVSLTAGLATLPAVAFYAQHFSVIFLVTNLSLLWMVEIIFTLGMIALLAGLLWVPLGKLAAIPVMRLLALFLRVDAAFASLSFADIGVDSPILWAAIAFSVGLLFFFSAKKIPLLRPLPLGLLLIPLLSSLLLTEIDASRRSFTLTVLPSASECALLSSHGVNFLIGWDEDAEELLVRKNIDRIDYLILPEGHEADELLRSFSVGEVLQGKSASFEVGDTLITLFAEGNLTIQAEDVTLSVLLAPGEIRESDAILLSREALKSSYTALWLQGEPVYAFGTPPQTLGEDICLLRHTYTSGELTFVAARGKLAIR